MSRSCMGVNTCVLLDRRIDPRQKLYVLQQEHRTRKARQHWNPDKFLGLAQTHRNKDIKTAYRRLALQFHPDVCKGKTCDARFVEIKSAYESLMITLGSSESQTPKGEVSSFHCVHSTTYANQTAHSVGSSREEDPWADFMHSLVNRTNEEQREDSVYQESQFSAAGSYGGSKTSASSHFERNW